MNDIASRTAGPDINEFLKNQKSGRVLPDVASANDGSERVCRQAPNRMPRWIPTQTSDRSDVSNVTTYESLKSQSHFCQLSPYRGTATELATVPVSALGLMPVDQLMGIRKVGMFMAAFRRLAGQN
jgi:hypothetical protein